MFLSRCWASGRVQVRAGVEIHGNGDRSGLSWSSITAKCWNAVFGFYKDWKMTEIINLTEGMMDLLMKIEGKRRRRFVPEHICYRGPGEERLLWQVECGAWERAEPQHTPHLLSLRCFSFVSLRQSLSMCLDCLRTLYEERPGWPWMQSFLSASKYWD